MQAVNEILSREERIERLTVLRGEYQKWADEMDRQIAVEMDGNGHNAPGYDETPASAPEGVGRPGNVSPGI